jgi:predicted transporter
LKRKLENALFVELPRAIVVDIRQSVAWPSTTTIGQVKFAVFFVITAIVVWAVSKIQSKPSKKPLVTSSGSSSGGKI